MQRARYPCRQLNSKTIRSAALCYLSPVFLGKCSVISAKCVCDVQEEGFENAWNNVCRNRDGCDRALHGLFVKILSFETCFLSCLVLLFISKSTDVDAAIFFLVSFTGIKNVAFFFSAISTQSLKKQTKKKKADEGDEDSDDNEHIPDSSQLASSTSQGWVTSHPTIVNQKLCPSLNYWIALTTPNGAPCNPLVIHRALLECRVDVIANQVTNSLLKHQKSCERTVNFKAGRQAGGKSEL